MQGSGQLLPGIGTTRWILRADTPLQVVDGLPKTRSGKIMRRILRKVAASEYDELGDITTLADPAVVEQIVSAHRAHG